MGVVFAAVFVLFSPVDVLVNGGRGAMRMGVVVVDGREEEDDEEEREGATGRDRSQPFNATVTMR